MFESKSLFSLASSAAPVVLKLIESGYEYHESSKISAKLKQIRDTKNFIYEKIPADIKLQQYIISTALDTTEETDERNKKTNVKLRQYPQELIWSSVTFGSGKVQDFLAEAAACFYDYAEKRKNRPLGKRGELDDYRSLVALHAIESLSMVAQRTIDAKQLRILIGLEEGWEKFGLTPLVKSKQKKESLKAALTQARLKLSLAIKRAEFDICNAASTEYLKMVRDASSTLFMRILPRIVILLFTDKAVSGRSIEYSSLDKDNWGDFHNTLIQAILYRGWGSENRANTVGPKTSSHSLVEKFIDALQISSTTGKESKDEGIDQYIVFVENLKKVRLINKKAIYKYKKASGLQQIHEIESGFSEEFTADEKQTQNCISLLCKVLRLAHAIEDVTKAQDKASDYAKKFGDFGLYVKARKVLQALLPISQRLLKDLMHIIIDELYKQVRALSDLHYPDTQVPVKRAKNLRTLTDQLHGEFTTEITKAMGVLNHLLSHANSWTSRAKKINQQKEAQQLDAVMIAVKRRIQGLDILIPEIEFENDADDALDDSVIFEKICSTPKIEDHSASSVVQQPSRTSVAKLLSISEQRMKVREDLRNGLFGDLFIDQSTGIRPTADELQKLTDGETEKGYINTKAVMTYKYIWTKHEAKIREKSIAETVAKLSSLSEQIKDGLYICRHASGRKTILSDMTKLPPIDRNDSSYTAITDIDAQAVLLLAGGFQTTFLDKGEIDHKKLYAWYQTIQEMTPLLSLLLINKIKPEVEKITRICSFEPVLWMKNGEYKAQEDSKKIAEEKKKSESKNSSELAQRESSSTVGKKTTIEKEVDTPGCCSCISQFFLRCLGYPVTKDEQDKSELVPLTSSSGDTKDSTYYQQDEPRNKLAH